MRQNSISRTKLGFPGLPGLPGGPDARYTTEMLRGGQSKRRELLKIVSDMPRTRIETCHSAVAHGGLGCPMAKGRRPRRRPFVISCRVLSWAGPRARHEQRGYLHPLQQIALRKNPPGVVTCVRAPLLLPRAAVDPSKQTPAAPRHVTAAGTTDSGIAPAATRFFSVRGRRLTPAGPSPLMGRRFLLYGIPPQMLSWPSRIVP